MTTYLNMKNLGVNVKFYRGKIKYTQLVLAKKVGVSSNYIALIETGKKVPSIRTLHTLADVLGVGAKDLIDQDPLFEELRKLANQYGIDEISEKIRLLGR